MAVQDGAAGLPHQRSSLINDPTIRGIVFQALLAIGLIAFFWWIADNTVQNLQRAHIASGFGFLWARAGFDISQALFPYSEDFDLRPGLPGQPPQHASGGGAGHRFRLDHRLHARHRAPVQELADRPDRHHLRRDPAQHPGAAATPVLVQGGPFRAAGATAGLQPAARRQAQQSRADHSAPDFP